MPTSAPTSVFPASAIRSGNNATSRPPVSRETHDAARVAVRNLLEQSQAYTELPEDKRRELANNLVQIGSYLAEPDGQRLKPNQLSPEVRALAGDDLQSATSQVPEFGQAAKTGGQQMAALIEQVNFPSFVANLIHGVFDSIVQSSIQQMEAYAKLVADVSKSLNQFRDDNTTQNQGRDHLIEQFPDIFELSIDDNAFGSFGNFGSSEQPPPQPRVILRQDVDESNAVQRLNNSGLPLEKPLTSLDNDLIEALLVPAARTQIATGRQQLLATMVLMGINRIVVTDGKIAAKVMYDFKATDSRRLAYSATNYDYEKDAQGNVQRIHSFSGNYEGKYKGGSYSKSDDSEERRDGSYYAKGSYKYDQQPIVKLMATTNLMDDSQLATKASLAGNVEVNFKSDYLPLDKMATPENIAALQMNAQPGMLANIAKRPQAKGTVPATQPATSTPAQ